MKTALFIVLFSLSAPALHAQSVALVRGQCEAAKGSRRASEFVPTLKALAPSQLRDDAVSACEAKVQALKKAEDDKWNRALQARSGGQCALAKSLFDELAQVGVGTAYQREAGDQSHSLNCSGGAAASGDNGCAEAQSNLLNAQGALNQLKFDQAKRYATAAQSCPGTADTATKLLEEIDRRDKSRQLAQQAKLKNLQGDKDSACKFILQIDPSYPELKDLRAQVGECAAPQPAAVIADNGRGAPRPPSTGEKGKPEPPPDPFLADYNRAVGLENSKPGEAERIYQRILASDRGYKDVAGRLKQVQESQRINDFRELERRARNYLDKGDLQAAAGSIDRALTLRPGEASLKDFKQLVMDKLAQEANEVSSGINAYYGGKYAEAHKLLTSFANNPHSGRVLAFASFYAGSALASEYYLGGQSDSAKKEEAKKAFALALKGDKPFSPDWSVVKISPKVRSLFLEAAAGSGQK